LFIFGHNPGDILFKREPENEETGNNKQDQKDHAQKDLPVPEKMKKINKKPGHEITHIIVCIDL